MIGGCWMKKGDRSPVGYNIKNKIYDCNIKCGGFRWRLNFYCLLFYYGGCSSPAPLILSYLLRQRPLFPEKANLLLAGNGKPILLLALFRAFVESELRCGRRILSIYRSERWVRGRPASSSGQPTHVAGEERHGLKTAREFFRSSVLPKTLT